MTLTVLVSLAFVTSIAAFFRAWWDHTQLKLTIRSLEANTDELKKKIQVRGKLAGEIAHEIKNPITAIQCSAETLDLMLGEQLQPELRKSLYYIREYSDYLLRLLSDFLEVSRCEAGVNLPKPEVINISDSVNAVAGLLKSYAMKKHLTLNVGEVPSNAKVWADSRHVKQIIFNLVHNSIKFTRNNGTIEISAKTAPHQQFVEISVKDNGNGIPESELTKIFDPYQRYEGNQPRFDTGVGLGLGLCKNLVELAGGDISVESTLGKGSTFTFHLPKAPQVAEIKPEAPAKKELPGSTMFQPLLGQSYLVVDQDTATRDSIAKLIQDWGGMVDQVAQAVEAVEAVTTKAYDAVMVDSTLDGVSGYELASLLREHANASGTTIILATKATPDQELAQECGADRTIEKPLKGDRLLQSLLTAGKCQVTH